MNKQEILDEDAFLDTTLGLSDDELTRRFKEAVKLEKKRCKITRCGQMPGASYRRIRWTKEEGLLIISGWT